MSIILGSGDALKDLPIGNKKISKVVVGNKVVWQKKWKGLKFTANQDGSQVGISYGFSSSDLYYSTDGKTWTAWDGSNITLNKDEYMCLWNKNNTLTLDEEKRFYTSGDISISGDISSLKNFNKNFVDGEKFGEIFAKTSIVDASELIFPFTELTYKCFYNMFYACYSLVKAPKILPATRLAEYCYQEMFKGCTSLITAPELPATTLAEGCYSNMFYNCSSLTTAPELPATTLARYCYESMFQDCASLTTPPELPATQLAEYCYYSMFGSCISLTIAPDLPATQLANNCYIYMFDQCISLNRIKLLYTGNFDSTYFNGWVYNIYQNGILYYNGLDTTRGNSAIPTNFTIQQF